VYDVDPREWPTKREQLHHASYVFRDRWPSEPTLEQLRQTIKDGDDTLYNLLVLNVDGQFELRQAPPFNQLANDPSIVVRHEITIAGNGYVGPEASRDTEFVQGEFAASLEYWRDHLETHKTQEFCEQHSGATLAELQAQVKALKARWKSDY
jgi:hypothetical protein